MFNKQDIHEPAQLHPDSARLLFGVETYLLRTLLILGTLIQWFLLWKLWIYKPLPEILGEINGLAPPCEEVFTYISVHLHLRVLTRSV